VGVVVMSFAETGNGNVVVSYQGGNTHKAAELVTFPNIEGRDAPYKTGAAAKPALVSQVGLFLGAYNNPPNPVVRLGMWTSTGTNFASSGDITLSTAGSTLRQATITSRPVFSGTQYWVGFAIINPVFVPPADFGVRWGMTAGADTGRRDTTPFATSNNFLSEFQAGVGALAYRLYYDVLPTAPLNSVAVISGAASTSITLTWDAPASDGGRPVTGYRIQRSSGAAFTTIVANSNSTSRIFIDTNLTPGVNYFYIIAAINEVATVHGSDYSGPYSAIPNGTLVPGASAGNAQSLLTVTVDDPEPLAASFSDFGLGIRFTNIDVQYGSENLYNEVEATTKDDFAELQIASAPTSKTLYGVRSYSFKDLLNATDEGALEVAKDYLTYYFQPELRVDSITVDLSNLTLQEKLQVLALEIDSYITVSFTPNGVGDPKITSGLVTGISHRITITSHEVELRLRTERNLFTLNSESKGILNVNILGP
jgi:hypothetical protein